MLSSLAPCEMACKQVFCRPVSVSAFMSRMKLIVCKVMTAPSLIGCLFESFHSLREVGSHQFVKGVVHE